MGVMSPESPKNEWLGMIEAQEFFMARPFMSPEMIRFFGDQVKIRRDKSSINEKGIGFQRAAYIISMGRGFPGRQERK